MYQPLFLAVIIAATGVAGISLAATKPTPARVDLYVATAGSDQNRGSKSQPFQTIQRAASVATPGTTVHVAPGVYRENVKTTAHGAKGARIRYVSATKWGAKIVGSGTEATWANSGDFVDIVGFDVSGSGRIGIMNLGSYTLIARNHVHDIAVSGGCTSRGGAGIVNANYAASDGDIIGNVVHDIGVPGKCNGVQGIYSSNLRGRIYNNIVYRASSFGIALWHAANHVTIANNTVFSNGNASIGGGIVIGAGDSPGGVVLDHTKVINNIVFNNPKSAIIEYCYPGQECTGAKNTIANNLVYGNGSRISLRKGTAKGNIEADPQFVNFKPDGSGSYRLKRTSPAVNSGLATYAPSTDIDNAPRARGKAPDLGAYENY